MNITGHFRVSLPLILTIILLSVSLASAVEIAIIYDDFNKTGINHAKWALDGSGFSQPGDGYLHYSGAGPNRSYLTSATLFTSGVFTMPFSDYRCNNEAPPGQGLGSLAALGLGLREANHWVRIERGQVRSDPAHGSSGAISRSTGNTLTIPITFM